MCVCVCASVIQSGAKFKCVCEPHLYRVVQRLSLCVSQLYRVVNKVEYVCLSCTGWCKGYVCVCVRATQLYIVEIKV